MAAKTIITWTDLRYTVNVPKYLGLGGFTPTEILHGLNGSINEGELVAILGPSGSGKSTFLDCVSGRVDVLQNRLDGKIEFFGRKIEKQDFTYVMQEDALEGSLSVRENLRYSAYLRLPESMSRDEQHERVETVIEQLGLTNCADTWIGNKFVRGVSGGERRRCTIGMELIPDPPVLIMDEPTSGLDSKTSHELVLNLKKLCAQGKTIICTIHQPSSYVFSLFDKILLLSGGNTVFYGSPDDAELFFKSNGQPIPPFTNPSDHYLSLLNVDFQDEGGELKEVVSKLVTSFNEAGPTETKDESLSDSSNKDAENLQPKYETNFFTQTYYLTTRLFTVRTRDPVPFFSRIFQYFFMGCILLGTLYLQLPLNTDHIVDKIGIIFTIAGFIIWFPLSTIEIFLGLKARFLNERINGYYAVLPFNLAEAIVNTSMAILFGLVFIIPLYWLVGLNPEAEAFFYACFMTVSVICSAEALVSLVSSFVPNFITGIALIAFFNLTFVMASGFFIKVSLIPGWWIWVYYIDPVRYSFQGLLKNEFGSGNRTYECTPGYNNGTCICQFEDLNSNCVNEGNEILAYFNSEGVNKWGFLGVTIGFTILFRLVNYLVHRFLNTGKK